MELLEKISRAKQSRRGFLASAGAVGAAALLGGCNDSSSSTGTGTSPTPAPLDVPDNDILNFALNLEYLEAEFYLRAATGSGLPSALLPSGSGSVTGGAAVAGLPTFMQYYLNAIAQDEMNHVAAIQATITANSGTPVARPNIDFTNAFNGLASLATIGSVFNPFDGTAASLLIGAFVFEDVGVTAYNGAAPSITSTNILNAAAGIVAVEAYHAAEVRTLLVGLGNSAVLAAANMVAALRASVTTGASLTSSASASGLNSGAETMLSISQIVNADSTTAVGFSRNSSQVLKIVYAGGTASGGFFPNGMNGTIKSA